MTPETRLALRRRAIREWRKSLSAMRRRRWKAAERHHVSAVALIERAVEVANYDDDLLLLAEILTTGSTMYELSRDGAGALSAARAAVDVYRRLDRDLDDPRRVTRRLGPDSLGLIPPQLAQGLLIATLDAQLRLAELLAEHKPTTGAAEAGRLATVALETARAVEQFSRGFTGRPVTTRAERHEAVLERLAARNGTESTHGTPNAQELTGLAERESRARSEALTTQAKWAESQADRARSHHAAGRHTEAVDAMRKAVELYRKVAADTVWYKRELGRSLYDFAHQLEARGDRGAAVGAMAEASLVFGQVVAYDRRFADEVLLSRRELRRLRLVRIRLRGRSAYRPPMAT